jgi:hypothetical protein
MCSAQSAAIEGSDIMATVATQTARIGCINKNPREDRHHAITHVGGYTDKQWKITQPEAIVMIERGEWNFYTMVGERRADVIVSTHNGRKYLKTTADDDTPDNLLSLPECPWRARLTPTQGARLSTAFLYFHEVIMPSFNVAHLREQGQDMLLFPLDDSFDNKSSADQNSTVAQLQMRANRAGLAGRAVAVWQRGSETRFLGPPSWRAFFQSIDMSFVLANVNREISW